MASSLNKLLRLRHTRLITVMLLAIAACLITYGGYGFWQRYHATHNPNPTITKQVITHSTATPDETKPVDACDAYRATTGYPERINIPAIGAAGCIEQVGIDQNESIAVPNNIYTAAWYTKSVLPGQQGVSVIVGHISGRYNVNGIFQNLNSLKNGDTLTVSLGGGEVLNYLVFKEQSVSLSQAVQVLLAKDPDVTSQLNLITCGGRYDPSTKLYDHRIIVSAKLISN